MVLCLLALSEALGMEALSEALDKVDLSGQAENSRKLSEHFLP